MLDKIALLGPAGTFCHEAAEQYYDTRTIKQSGLLCPNNPSVVQAVAEGSACQGVLPIENSTEGIVSKAVDALHGQWSRGKKVHIRGALVLPVSHTLITQPGVRLDEITTITTHEQAYHQCSRKITQTLGQPDFIPASSTADAVRTVLNSNDRTTAAIGSRRAAELYGGEVQISDFQDDSRNKTRFLILSDTTDHEPTGNDQTLIMFSCAPGEPGSLMRMLVPPAEYGLNATMIISRPIHGLLKAYYFCMVFEGHRNDPSCRQALEIMRRQAEWFYVLGSFPQE